MNPDSLQVEQAVLGVQQSFWTALKSKDVALFERVLADDFVSLTDRGPAQSRTDFIDTLTTFTGDVISVEGEDISVYPYRDIAVLVGVQRARLQLPNGVQVTDSLRLNNVFRQSNGEWLLVLAHPVQLKDEE